jgi:hydroxymethylglutaryl-CoA lyase
VPIVTYVSSVARNNSSSSQHWSSSNRNNNSSVRIVEVGPRDGLQNESQQISVENKLQLIQKLESSGINHIEVGSFVSPKWIPQMADSDKVLEGLLYRDRRRQQERKDSSSSLKSVYSVLIPNLKGLEIALQDPIYQMVHEIAIFASASEEFSKRNINSTIDESMDRFRTVLDHLRQHCQQHQHVARNNDSSHNIRVRGYVSTIIACPYEGPILPRQVAKVVEKMLDLGCYEVSLGDTTGVGTPGTTRNMLKEVLVRFHGHHRI